MLVSGAYQYLIDQFVQDYFWLRCAYGKMEIVDQYEAGGKYSIKRKRLIETRVNLRISINLFQLLYFTLIYRRL
jgi:hypothetical protein